MRFVRVYFIYLLRTKFPCHRLYDKKVRAVQTLVAAPHRKDRTGGKLFPVDIPGSTHN
jgi:hypothetical protein